MNFLSNTSIRNLVYSTGITSITKNSIITLNNIYKEIVLNIALLSQQNNYINTKNVFDTLKKIKETMLQSKRELVKPLKACKTFKKKASQFKSSNKYKTAKINFYRKIKNCTLTSSKHFEKIFKKLTDTNYSPDALYILQKASDKIFQKYITVLVYKLFKQDVTTITSQHIDASWEKFLDKYPKTTPKYDWITLKQKNLDQQFHDFFNIKRDESVKDEDEDENDIYYLFSNKKFF